MSRQILPWPDRFWTRVELGPTMRPELGPCVVWNGGRTKADYGTIKFFGKLEYTHRVAYQITHGPILSTIKVLYRCDNPPCVRVDHLRTGTHRENMQDRDAKKRGFLSSPRWEKKSCSCASRLRPKICGA